MSGVGSLLGKLKESSSELLDKAKLVPAGKGESAVKDAPAQTVAGLKRQINQLLKKKETASGYLGLKAYELYKEQRLTNELLEKYFQQLSDLDAQLEQAFKEKEELERANKKGNYCDCGCKLGKNSKFCPECGKKILGDTITCKCGKELKRTVKFCPECGTGMEELIAAEEKEESSTARAPETAGTKFCICGAVIAPGQFMCLECGRPAE